MATNLKDLIDTLNAEDIPTNIFTIEDKDPNVILGKLNEVIAYLEELQTSIDASDTKANKAIADALSAIQTAQEALTTANGIDAKATQALENATTALSTANTAISSSNTALSTANTAISTANTAISSANSAVETASNANTKSTNAVTIANSASETANGIDAKATQALENSTNALNTANTANTNASNAVNTANSALEQVIQGQGTKVYNRNTLLSQLDIKPYVNYDNYFAVNTAGKYGKLFVSDKLTQSWDSITLIFEISDKNGVNNTRGVARYSITYRGNGTNAPGLKVTRLFGDANYDSVLFINYVSTPYVDANSNYFELYYLGSYDGDDARKFQVISYSRRSSEEVGYTLNKGALVKLDEITSIGTVSKFTDIVLVYYCAKNQPATITGAWNFETNSAKFKVGTDVYRIPLTAPAGSSTEKRYILATSGYGQPATMFNPNVFQQDNHIYSNASQVVNLADEQTMTGLKNFDNAKFKVNDNDYRAPLTAPAVEIADKRFLTGVSGLSTKFTNINSNCYMQDGKLYSNAKEVALTIQTYKRLYTSISELGITATTCTISELAQKIIDSSYTNSKVLINIENNSPITGCPSSYGTLEIEVPSLSIRMSIKFTVQRGNQSLNSTYFGYLTRSGNTVTAFEWRKALTNNYDWIGDVLNGNVGYGDKIVGKSIGSNGYIKLVSGLLIQWGTYSRSSASGDFQDNISLPTVFSNTNYKVILNSFKDTTDMSYRELDLSILKKYTSYFTFAGYGNPQPWKVDWIAIGY